MRHPDVMTRQSESDVPKPPTDRHGRLGVALASAAFLMLLAACTTRASAPHACAGQCQPPYVLDVLFQTTTAVSTAQAVLDGCAANKTVIRVEAVRSPNVGERPEGHIYTRDIGEKPATTPLLECLRRQPEVSAAAWPD